MPRIFDSFALVAAQAEAELTALFGDLADVLKDLREIFLHASATERSAMRSGLSAYVLAYMYVCARLCTCDVVGGGERT